MYRNRDRDREGDKHERARLTPLNEAAVGLTDDARPQTNKREDEEPQEVSTETARQAAESNGSNEQASQTILDEDEAPASAELLCEGERRGTLKRMAVAAGVVLGLLTFLGAVSYFWLLGGRGDEMSYQVKNTQSAANSPSASESSQGITQEEITREMKKPSATADSSSELRDITLEANPQAQGGSPITDRLPNDGFSATVSPNSDTAQQTVTEAAGNANQETTPASRAPTGNAGLVTQAARDSRPNAEHSIRISTLQARAASDASEPSISTPQNLPLTNGTPKPNTVTDAAATDLTSGRRTMEQATVPLPPLGTMLPVRTLGTVFTLRNDSFVRMSLTRDVAGRGWRFPRGTEFYGVLRGAELETGRAFVSLVGFVDASTNRLVRLQGYLLGGDGSDGVRGRRHKLDSGWARALKTAGAGVVNVLSTVAAGLGRRPVYIGDIYGSGAPQAIDPLAQEISGITYGGSRRSSGFVELPANSVGYILVMTTPREIQGVEADTSLPTAELRRLSDTSVPRTSAHLSEQELAELMTSGDHDDIRLALPRMSPEMRHVAEVVLSQR